MPPPVNALEAAIDVLGEDSELVARRETYKKQGIDVAIREAGALSGQKDYAAAIDMLQRLRAQYPEDPDVAQATRDVETAYVGNTVERANASLADGAYYDAFEALYYGLVQYPQNEALQSAIENVRTQEMNHILAEAEAFARERKHEDAIELLQGSAYAAESDIKTAIAEYTEYLPVWLDTMEAMSWVESDSDSALWIWNQDTQDFERDNIEDTHEHGVAFAVDHNGYVWEGDSEWAKAEYFLGKAYSLFEGTFALNFDSRNTLGMFTLEAYVDDALIYTSEEIRTGTLPFDISLDVSDGETVTFHLEGIWPEDRGETVNLSLVDAAFYK